MVANTSIYFLQPACKPTIEALFSDLYHRTVTAMGISFNWFVDQFKEIIPKQDFCIRFFRESSRERNRISVFISIGSVSSQVARTTNISQPQVTDHRMKCVPLLHYPLFAKVHTSRHICRMINVQGGTPSDLVCLRRRHFIAITTMRLRIDREEPEEVD